ncbi:hypothetical protein HHI36_011007 [Cryptolaemus montrouzieri]|uniref:Uncharacterized protein n=1 Tax=Cryptolaemus montrouzieri TaxID=559131 RepID=A0ABD2MKJ1_9CUCU
MPGDINEQIEEKLLSLFGIQLDEANDTNDDAQSVFYVRHIQEINVFQDLLFYRIICEDDKATDLFSILDSHIIENNIKLCGCVYGWCSSDVKRVWMTSSSHRK